MSEEEIALRLIESDCSTDYYFKILNELENHTTKIQELEKEKAHIEIAYEEDYKEQQQEIERLKSIIKEVREEIEYFDLQARHLDDSIYLDERLTNKLLEILDKAGDEK